MNTTRHTLIDRFAERCLQFPTKVALHIDGIDRTYEQFSAHIQAWKEYLHSLGMQPQSRVFITSSHRYDFLGIFLALWQLDCIPVPYEPSVAPPELAHALQEARANWLISEIPAHKSALAENISLFTPPLQPSWLVARMPSADDTPCPEETALLIYTSGTKGSPKCVIYDHATLEAVIDSLLEAYHLTEHDIILTPLSPALSATLITGLLPGLMSGATLILPSEPVPNRILRLIAEQRVTIFFAVPYIYDLLSKTMEARKKGAWGSVRWCLSTSAYLPGRIFDVFYQQTKLPIRSIYCTSEANQCTFNASQERECIRNSVGQVQSGVQLKVVDDAGQQRAPGQEGEIIVSGTHLSKGYYHRPQLEQHVYRNGWVYTGDLGILDENGYLSLTGRLSDTINVSGHLVQPQEVETTLLAHSQIAEALVLGEGDPQIGEQVVGWIVLHTEATVTTEEIIDYCNDNLVHYKVPVRIEFVDALPKGRYGKIRRLTPLAFQIR